MKPDFSKHWKILAGGAVILIVAFSLGRCTAGETIEPKTSSQEPQASLWTCSMHPQIKLPEPGQCPICGMDLIPLEAGGAADSGPRELTISKSSAKLMQIETAPVDHKFVETEVRMIGKVDYDETRTAFITARMPGRLDRLFVDYTGIPVKKDDHLASIYSPELLSAQEELLQAIRSVDSLKKSGSDIVRSVSQSTVEAVREKLRLWGLPDEQIQEIEQRGTTVDHLTLYSPVSGIVIHKNAQEGSYVKTGDKLYTVADLTKVWVKLEAYESDLSWLRYGQKVTFTVEALPGHTFEGTIAFIDPVLNAASRTVNIRVNVDNPDQQLKPGMFVRAVAHPVISADGQVANPSLAGKWISPMHPEVVKDQPGPCDVCGMPLVKAEELGYVTSTPEKAPLVIPVTAPLITGKRAVVYVEIPGTNAPTYEGREITLGPKAGHYYVVADGLSEGERVVTHGAFKLDAELQIQAKPSMMSMPSEAMQEDHAGHAHTSSSTMKQTAPDEFIMQLSTVLQAYYDLSGALAADDPSTAKAAAAKVKDALGDVNMALLEGEGHMIWMEHLKNLNAALAALNRSTELSAQREAFESLSRQLAQTVQTFPLGQTVYQAYCPMAFDNAGATWLQSSNEVTNPYFGQMMLRCGEIKQTFGERNE